MASNMLSCAEAKHLLEQTPAFSLVHFNTRSLRGHYDDLVAFLSIVEHSFSVICLSETWLSADEGHLYALPGYESEYCHRVTNRGGGSAVLITSSIPYKRRQDLFFDINCESVWLEVESSALPLNNRHTVIASIYRSPSSSNSEFCVQLERILATLTLENKNIIICGDVNINILDTNTPVCLEYVRCFLSFGLQSLIHSPTRCDMNGSNTLIDHVLSNIFADSKSGVIDYLFTDHYPVFFCLDACIPIKNKHNTKTVFNSAEFVEIVRNADWDFVAQEECGEEAFNEFSAKISAFIAECTTTSTVIHWFRTPRNPWITPGLLHSISKKENMRRKLKSQPSNSSLKTRLKRYSNLLSMLLKRAKREYYEKQIDKNGNDTRKNWQLIKKFLNSSETTCLSKITVDGRSLTEPLDIANAFSDTFASNSPDSLVDLHFPILSRSPQSFYLRPTSADEVFQIMSSLKTKGPGLDSIHPSKIKLVARELSPILAEIINKLFKAGAFPDALKVGKITPVFKKGDRLSTNNYRPICVLPFFSKVIEKLFYLRLMCYLLKFNLLSPHQFGFRPDYSTELALLSFTDRIKQAIDDGLLTGAVFIDLTKAFDTINHRILLCKLESFGIVGPALQFIRNYLTNRSQVVYVNNIASSAKPVTMGVPQGSILGPLLFLLFINDLPSSLNHTNCLLYADDTTIFTSQKTTAELESSLNSDLCNIYQWCVNNHLYMNPSKTTFVVFSSAQNTFPSPVSVSLNNHIISVSDHVKFLGVILDKHLKYNYHVLSILKKASFGIHVLIKARPYFQSRIILSLYYAYIHSHLSYCISSWGNTYASHLEPLLHLQKRALRLIAFAPFQSPSTPLFIYFSVLPINLLFTLKLAILMYRLIYHGLCVSGLSTQHLVNTNNTRFSACHNFLLPKVRSNYGKLTLKFTGVSVWNNIPLEIKLCPTFYSFRKMFKEYLITKRVF